MMISQIVFLLLPLLTTFLVGQTLATKSTGPFFFLRSPECELVTDSAQQEPLTFRVPYSVLDLVNATHLLRTSTQILTKSGGRTEHVVDIDEPQIKIVVQQILKQSKLRFFPSVVEDRTSTFGLRFASLLLAHKSNANLEFHEDAIAERGRVIALIYLTDVLSASQGALEFRDFVPKVFLGTRGQGVLYRAEVGEVLIQKLYHYIIIPRYKLKNFNI
jgi:hypothetical protein